MLTVNEFIQSGILEMYVLGNTNAAENAQVETMASTHLEVKNEIEAISGAIVQYAMAHAIEPDVTIKPFLMATIDYMDRLEHGEQPVASPVLNESTRASDFSESLNRHDMVLPQDFESFYAKIIGYTPDLTTAIVWINDMAPGEVHHDEYENFFILEGACDIFVEGKPHSLVPGDFFAIPLHKNHSVQVTSSIPCKVILQRMAA